MGARAAAGPLVARRDPAVPLRRAAAPRRSWFRRFVGRHGWRAYAVPLLTIATLITLVDVVTTDDGQAGHTATAAGPATALDAPATTAGAMLTTPDAPAQGEGAPTSTAAAPAVGSFVEQGAGTVSVVDGSSAVYGTGPLERFVVEVEDGIGVDGVEFATAVETTLGDPRSWGHGGGLGRHALALGG